VTCGGQTAAQFQPTPALARASSPTKAIRHGGVMPSASEAVVGACVMASTLLC